MKTIPVVTRNQIKARAVVSSYFRGIAARWRVAECGAVQVEVRMVGRVESWVEWRTFAPNVEAAAALIRRPC